MNETKNEPAFPVVANNWHTLGMTLRDYFAAKAMQAILKDQYENGIYSGMSSARHEDDCAKAAYVVADAMLEAREK